MKVVLVDDADIIREQLTNMISEMEGIEIIGEARGPREAEAIIERLKPHAVILDIHLEGGNGIDVLETIKQFPFAPKVIVLTHYSYPQYREVCLKAGAEFFFNKSMGFSRVPSILKQWAEEYSR